MTRMQKWQSYRDEIAKQTTLGKSIAADELNLQKYKTEIDKIDPAILSSVVEYNPSLQRGVSNVEISQTQISTKIADMFATINKAANTINHDTVESIFYNLKNDKIVDKKTGKFNEDKLLTASKEYAWFNSQIKTHDFHSNEKNELIKKELKDKYSNLTAPNEQHNVDIVYTINKNSEKQASHYVFVISIAVSLLLLVIVVSLFITKVVLK